MDEPRNQEVRILAASELLAEMEGKWSPLVQVMVERPKRPGDPWAMTIRTISQAFQEFGDDLRAGLAKWAAEMEGKNPGV